MQSQPFLPSQRRSAAYLIRGLPGAPPSESHAGSKLAEPGREGRIDSLVPVLALQPGCASSYLSALGSRAESLIVPAFEGTFARGTTGEAPGPSSEVQS